ncbi:MAG: bifunctional diaminohydroxyphosphoribosylaminopyrimidine deaminase/5-amino-6-(5-phosphoribosylamino)uracil reductase RibD [Planctomycetes bacterium]|nr:bifunctional diaminohydroxyphosphoribosylaminopyrimidine deaminase/5-amino-6-(5-phosphoribosylamino)uracil reductase RibD [Planctomycetota bacterium]MCC7172918.1 bifunctional diaminohydroxyphosphoribosylaminopyrimidine deaminase/5-amino-6-(5-phosphoribosylamino)uracil reductase RibD [Planctomycetota bacterium]
MRPASESPSASAWLDRAVELAARGAFLVEPNPRVGALVVTRDGATFEGWHTGYGGPHAEVTALRAAGEAARGSTVVVTLEPCSTHGKTPACTDALIAAGVVRVMYACDDPYGPHRGRAAALLRNNGIEVVGPVAHSGARRLLARFEDHLHRARAFVTAKWAMSLDGKIATASGDSKWITSETARSLAHELRGHVDGIAVGVATVSADDPRLTARPPGPRNAHRIVFDRRLKTPSTWVGLVEPGPPVLLVHGPDASPSERARCEAAGASLLEIRARTDAEFVELALVALRARGIASLMVEGGGTLLGAFADARCIDRVAAFIAPRVVGGERALGAVGGQGAARVADGLVFDEGRFESIGNDVVYRGLVARGP